MPMSKEELVEALKAMQKACEAKDPVAIQALMATVEDNHDIAVLGLEMVIARLRDTDPKTDCIFASVLTPVRRLDGETESWHAEAMGFGSAPAMASCLLAHMKNFVRDEGDNWPGLPELFEHMKEVLGQEASPRSLN